MAHLTRFEFGKALLEQLNDGYDPTHLAHWAYQVHLNSTGIDPGLEFEMLKLIAMEQGPEFLMSESELRELAAILQATQ